MDSPQIVLDTNVLVAALRSHRGASRRLFDRIDAGIFELNISVPLVLEYEEVCKRSLREISLTAKDVDDLLDFLCRVAHHRTVSFLWRPLLSDPDDELVLELAVAASCSHIVTFNKADFREAKLFGIQVATPREFLQEIGDLP